MAILRIRELGDPVLREPARDVERFDLSLRRLGDDMLETMYDAPGVGLAAPQVGLSLRFFVFDPGDGSGPGAMANPMITSAEGEAEEEEGCLSIPGVYHPTRRAFRVRVEGLSLDGEALVLEGEELVARIFQHETDHLDGRLYIDRLSEEGRRKVLSELRERELRSGAERFGLRGREQRQ
jgi:peptide deformylase